MTEMIPDKNNVLHVIPDGKIVDFIDGKLRNDTPEEYVRQNIEKRLMALTDLLIQRLKEKGYQIVSSLAPKERSGIICFKSREHSSTDLCKRLVDNGIIVSDRAGAVRVSPHFYNSEQEIEQMIEVLP